MCGRYTLRTPSKELAKAFGVEEVPEVEARFNITPAQTVAGVRRTPDGREMKFLKWGLVPSWAKDTSMGTKLINARSETVAEKPAFRDAFKRRRCLIPADGFYEWKREGDRKQPYFFRLREERPFAFAGLWDRWQPDGEDAVESCTILTTEANSVLRPVHDRMPVILHPDDYEAWLDDDVRKSDLLKELLQPYPAREMTGYPVSPTVNSARRQGEQLIKLVPVNSL